MVERFRAQRSPLWPSNLSPLIRKPSYKKRSKCSGKTLQSGENWLRFENSAILLPSASVAPRTLFSWSTPLRPAYPFEFSAWTQEGFTLRRTNILMCASLSAVFARILHPPTGSSRPRGPTFSHTQDNFELVETPEICILWGQQKCFVSFELISKLFSSVSWSLPHFSLKKSSSFFPISAEVSLGTFNRKFQENFRKLHRPFFNLSYLSTPKLWEKGKHETFLWDHSYHIIFISNTNFLPDEAFASSGWYKGPLASVRQSEDMFSTNILAWTIAGCDFLEYFRWRKMAKFLQNILTPPSRTGRPRGSSLLKNQMNGFLFFGKVLLGFSI